MKEQQLELFDRIPLLEKRAAFSLNNSSEYVCIDDIRNIESKIKCKHEEVFSVSTWGEEVTCRNRITSNVGKDFQAGDNKYRGISIPHYMAISEFLKKKRLVFNKKTLLMKSLS